MARVGESFSCAKTSFADRGNFSNENFGEDRNNNAGQFGNAKCRLTDDACIQGAVDKDDPAYGLRILFAEDETAVLGKPLFHGVVNLFDNDDGLFGGADDTVVERLRHQDRGDGPLDVCRFVDDGGRIAGAYADGRFS